MDEPIAELESLKFINPSNSFPTEPSLRCHKENATADSVLMKQLADLENQLERKRKEFFKVLLNKKKVIRRTWMEANSLGHSYQLQILPYKAMLRHVSELTLDRVRIIAEGDESSHQADASP